MSEYVEGFRADDGGDWLERYARRFGANLRWTLAASDMTNRELSRVTGISETTIATYKTGRAMPNGGYVALIARALGVSTDYLLGLKGDGTVALRDGMERVRITCTACGAETFFWRRRSSGRKKRTRPAWCAVCQEICYHVEKED